MYKQMVVGFAINNNKVLLINKLKPKWQKGKLNGVGGKIKKDENPVDAMIREFYEEAGVTTKTKDWIQICNIFSTESLWVVYFFVTEKNVYEAKSVEQEQVGWIDIDNLPDNTISNLRWLLPMARYLIDHKENIGEGTRRIFFEGVK